MERSCRPQRQRRHSRRAWPPEYDDQSDSSRPRPVKRLFTPEIKRMLKDWLIRRRENPYPCRNEKKRLAYETGLTYTQICNWFANWRRKLKNSERERGKRSWGHLIKNYNTNTRGNVEQFSISSEDSIWAEREEERRRLEKMHLVERSNNCFVDEDENDEEMILTDVNNERGSNRVCCTERSAIDADCILPNRMTPLFYYTHLLPTSLAPLIEDGNDGSINNNQHPSTKYKQKMTEKYLREEQVAAQVEHNWNRDMLGTMGSSSNDLSRKWMESAANFTPNKNNYFIEWDNNNNNTYVGISNNISPIITTGSISKRTKQNPGERINPLHAQRQHADEPNQDRRLEQHHKDELDAAEALANLAFNFRQRIWDQGNSSSSATITVAHMQTVSS